MSGTPLKVLYLIGSFRQGGAEKNITQILSHADATCIAPEVACFEAGGAYVPVVERLGVPVHVLGVRAPLVGVRNLGPLLRLAALVRRRRIDILHSYLVAANIFAAVAAWLARVPHIASLRSANSRESPRLLRAHLWALRRARGVVAVSAEARRTYAGRGIDPDKITVIENGVEVVEAGETQAESRRYFDLPASGRIITSVANLGPEKDHATLLQAARSVIVRHPSAFFALAGTGPMQAEVEQQVKALRLEDHVRLLGHVRDVRRLLNATDIFCLTSLVEGMSNALLEAMAAGLPAVVTDAGSNARLVVDGETGRVVPVRDPRALAAALDPLVGSAALAAPMGQAARDRAVEEFSIERMIATLQGRYAGVVA
ncbi:MAG: glycosyltransferase [Acidobacteriota bacterium]